MKKTMVAALLLSASSLALSAVEYSFTATVTESRNEYNCYCDGDDIAFDGEIDRDGWRVGEQFTVTLHYDPDSVIEIYADVSLGEAYSGSEGTGVWYHNTSAADYDYFQLNFPLYDYGDADTWIRFTDDSDTLFPDDEAASLPGSLDFSRFSSIEFGYSAYESGYDFADSDTLSATLVPVGEVPIPAAAWLFMTALISLVAARRRA